MIGNSDDKTSFPHELLLTNRQVANLLKDFDGVFRTTGNPAFCLFLNLTGVNFQGSLQYSDDVSEWKIKCRPVGTREIGVDSLSDVLYVLLNI